VFDKEGRATEGTYGLVWKAPADWQDKFRLGDFSQERTAVGDKFYVSRITPSITYEVFQLLKLLDFPMNLRFNPEAVVQKSKEQIRNGLRVRTIELALPGISPWKTIFLDETSPTPTRAEYNHGALEWEFGNYASFHGHEFPHLLTEFDSHKTLIEVRVQELTEASTNDFSIAPSPEARWYRWCPHPKPPKLLESNNVRPGLFLGPLNPHGAVAIYGVIGPDGKWHNLTVVKSGDKERDENLMKILRAERYSTATCEEVPVLEESVLWLYLPGRFNARCRDPGRKKLGGC
jgi:hypothetical protein